MVLFEYTSFPVCFPCVFFSAPTGFYHLTFILITLLVLLDTQWCTFISVGHSDGLIRLTSACSFQNFPCPQFKLATMKSLAILISHQVQSVFKPWHDIISWSLQPMLQLLPLLYYFKMFSPPPTRHCQTLFLILNQGDSSIYRHSSNLFLFFFSTCKRFLINICLLVATCCIYPVGYFINRWLILGGTMSMLTGSRLFFLNTLFLCLSFHWSCFSHWVKEIRLTCKNRPWPEGRPARVLYELPLLWSLGLMSSPC